MTYVFNTVQPQRLILQVCILIIQSRLFRVYPSLETLIEPHRFLQSLTALISVIPATVRDESDANLRRHVVPLMNGLLPGIDFNDVAKSMLTLQALSMFSILVPIVDCSDAFHTRKDLTEVIFLILLPVYHAYFFYYLVLLLKIMEFESVLVSQF